MRKCGHIIIPFKKWFCQIIFHGSGICENRLVRMSKRKKLSLVEISRYCCKQHSTQGKMKIYLALFPMNRLLHPTVYLCILQVTYSLTLVLSAAPWQRECEMPLDLNDTSFPISIKGNDCIGWKANGRSGPGWHYLHGGEIHCENSEAHWSSWTSSLPPRCHYCHVCPRLELTPCSLLRGNSVTLHNDSPTLSASLWIPVCEAKPCGVMMSLPLHSQEGGWGCTHCGKWALLLLLRNGTLSLGSSNVCRKAALPFLWLPASSKDRYILSPQELSSQRLSEMTKSW